MRTLLVIFGFFFSFCKLYGQDIDVSLNKTTTLVFPEKILHIDLGSNQGIAFMVDEDIPKIVKLRINQLFIPVEKTNLLIITQSDKIFSFNVRYCKDVGKTIYIIQDSASVVAREIIRHQKVQQHSFTDSLYKILTNREKSLPRVISYTKGKIKLTLHNTYASDSTIYFSMNLQNQSSLLYNINYISIYLTTNPTRKLKATVSQDNQLPYSFFGPEITYIPTNSTQQFVIAIPKFTMENNQTATIEISEQNGGRHLKIKFLNNILLEATKLN